MLDKQVEPLYCKSWSLYALGWSILEAIVPSWEAIIFNIEAQSHTADEEAPVSPLLKYSGETATGTLLIPTQNDILAVYEKKQKQWKPLLWRNMSTTTLAVEADPVKIIFKYNLCWRSEK